MTGKPLTPAEQIAGYIKLTHAFFYLRISYPNSEDLPNIDRAADKLFACRRSLSMEMTPANTNLAFDVSMDGSEKYAEAA